MYEQLEQISRRPAPFEVYTAEDLWTEEHTSAQMLACHLDSTTDLASRRGKFVARSLDWISRRFAVGPQTRVADFGCGPGLYSNALARRGARVTGIDFSSRSLDYARQTAAGEGLEVRYVHRNYLEFETEERFDLILMIFCDFCALSPSQRNHLLRTFRTVLSPGGSVLLDVCSGAGFERRTERTSFELHPAGGFWSAGRHYVFLNSLKYEQARVMLDKYTVVEAQRTRTVYNWLQYFTPEELEREFAEAGLAIQERYADVAGTRYEREHSEFAVVASAKG